MKTLTPLLVSFLVVLIISIVIYNTADFNSVYVKLMFAYSVFTLLFILVLGCIVVCIKIIKKAEKIIGNYFGNLD